MKINIFLLITAVILSGNFITVEDTKECETQSENPKKSLHELLDPFGLSNRFYSVWTRGVEEK